MASTRIRSSPSGRLVTVSIAAVEAEPREVAPFDPTDEEPVSPVLVLRPAGHPPGLYLVSFCPIVVSVGFATITPFIAWSTPDLGVQIVSLGAFTATAPGTRVTPSVSIDSDGSAPITLLCEASIPIIGAPLLDLMATCNRLTLT